MGHDGPCNLGLDGYHLIAEEYHDPPTEDYIMCHKCQKWCYENCTDLEGQLGDLFACDLCQRAYGFDLSH